MAKTFFKEMGQPFEFPEGLLYDEKRLEAINEEKIQEANRVEDPKEDEIMKIDLDPDGEAEEPIIVRIDMTNLD